MFSLFLFEVKYYFKNLKEVIYFIGLFISIILLLPFGQHPALSYQELAPTILWVALAVAVSVNGAGLFQRDLDSGKIDLYQLTRTPIEGMVLVKWAAYYCTISLALVLLLPLAGLLLSIPITAWGHYGVGLLSGAAALSLLTALSSILMLGSSKTGAVLGLVALPLLIPIIIFGGHYLTTPGLMQPSLLFLWGFSVFLLPVLCLVGGSVIRAAN